MAKAKATATATATTAKRRVRIVQDENPESPLEFDSLGTMACWHRRYTLGHEQPSVTPDEFMAALPRGTIIHRLYLYDHSGLAISMDDGRFRAVDSAGWDWGCVGIIYVTPEQRRKIGTALKDVDEVLRAEVATYDQFLQGDVWGFVAEEWKECDHCRRGEWELFESCWGFYGSDTKTNGMREHLEREWWPLLDAAEFE